MDTDHWAFRLVADMGFDFDIPVFGGTDYQVDARVSKGAELVCIGRFPFSGVSMRIRWRSDVGNPTSNLHQSSRGLRTTRPQL